MKKNKNKKMPKKQMKTFNSIQFELAPLTRDVTCSKLQREGEIWSGIILSVECTLNIVSLTQIYGSLRLILLKYKHFHSIVVPLGVYKLHIVVINHCPGWKKSQIAKEKKQKHKMQETAELQDMKRKGVCWARENRNK